MARPTRTEPTARQAHTLRTVAVAVSRGELSPSTPSLAEATGAPTNSSAREDALALERMGLLGRTGAIDRFWVPTSAGWAAVGIEPPPGAPMPLVSPDRRIAAAVRDAVDAGEPLPARVVAVLEAVA